MHIAGINWVAVLAAALAFFAIGYVIHMRLVDLKAWNAAKHTDEASLSRARMASGAILPLSTAIGLAVLFSWGDVTGVGNGIKWGARRCLGLGTSRTLDEGDEPQITLHRDNSRMRMPTPSWTAADPVGPGPGAVSPSGREAHLRRDAPLMSVPLAIAAGLSAAALVRAEPGSSALTMRRISPIWRRSSVPSRPCSPQGSMCRNPNAPRASL